MNEKFNKTFVYEDHEVVYEGEQLMEETSVIVKKVTKYYKHETIVKEYYDSVKFIYFFSFMTEEEAKKAATVKEKMEVVDKNKFDYINVETRKYTYKDVREKLMALLVDNYYECDRRVPKEELNNDIEWFNICYRYTNGDIRDWATYYREPELMK